MRWWTRTRAWRTTSNQIADIRTSLSVHRWQTNRSEVYNRKPSGKPYAQLNLKHYGVDVILTVCIDARKQQTCARHFSSARLSFLSCGSPLSPSLLNWTYNMINSMLVPKQCHILCLHHHEVPVPTNWHQRSADNNRHTANRSCFPGTRTPMILTSEDVGGPRRQEPRPEIDGL